MHHESCYIDAPDDHRIFVNIWKKTKSTKKVRAILHINHGMAEHSDRYAALAERFVEEGYIVYGHDHRGHGKSVKHAELLGHYADKNGWEKVISDVFLVNRLIRERHEGTPIIIMGHSMGSFIVQAYLAENGRTVDAALLSGSALSDKLTVNFATVLAKLETKRSGPLSRSKALDFFSFGIYNREFKPTRTSADWLSRDKDEVDKYINDPLCGFLCTNQLWIDLVSGIKDIGSPDTVKKIPNDLPIFAFSGERDPLSYNKSKTHGIDLLTSHLKHSGQHYVTQKLYPGARHEILNETNRHEVIDDVLEWTEKACKLPPLKTTSTRAKKNVTTESA
ncbi:hypothetical protein A9Q99_26980 [Gammaproteobacteria bacterium 45_16_T64]|nr:hypothetical protein A9Q99_26980 [Gammaproteobacteria bacterium 45_16_T64]